MDTTIVLSILSLTTRPTLVFRLPCAGVPATGPVGFTFTPAIRRPSRLRRLGLIAALVLHHQDPGDRSPGLRDRAVVLQLPGREGEARLPQLLLGIPQRL